MDKKFEDLAKELFNDIQFYCTEDEKDFIFGSVIMKNSFIKLLEDYIVEFKIQLGKEVQKS